MLSDHRFEFPVLHGHRGAWSAILVAACLAAGSPCAGQPIAPRVSAAAGHSLLLKSDGTVWAWGNGQYGVLGNGAAANSSVPVQVLGIGSIVAVAAGTTHNVALRNDGTIFTWGANYNGQLGTGTPSAPVLAPVPVPGLSGITAIAAGVQHSLALRGDGTVFAWGGNAEGQVGNGTTAAAASPVAIAAVAGSIAVGAGEGHSLAVKSNGTVWAWGYNVFGQLGNGNTSNSLVPVQVPGVTGAAAATGGFGFTAVRKTDGTVWAWGDNNFGQFGNGTLTSSLVPVQVPGLAGVAEVDAGSWHALARRNDGTVWTWGDSPADSTTTVPPDLVPVQVPFLTGVVAIAADSAHNLAIAGDRSVWAWGHNYDGCFGDGSPFVAPTPVLNQRVPTPAAALSSGEMHGLALVSGSVVAFGGNAQGQLGAAVPLGISPVTVPGIAGATKAAAGGRHSLAVLGDGTVRAWGSNSGGQLGNGTTTSSSSPVPVSGLTSVIAVSGGSEHSLAVRSNGAIWGFGRNNYGQLGTGTTSANPVTIPALSQSLGGFVAVSAGGTHSLGLMANGGVSSAGRNNYGQLGYSTSGGNGTVFGQIGGLNGMIAIAAGSEHSLAVRNDGRVYAWGYNNNGQLGTGTLANAPQPAQIPGFTGGLAVAASYRHSLVLKSDGTVWAFGQNTYGQLGDGTFTNRLSPVQVQGLTGIVAVAAGASHSFALGSDGSIWSWGSNTFGLTGSGAQTTVPVRSRIHADLPVQPWIDLARGPGGSATLTIGGIPAGAGSGLTLLSAASSAPLGQGALWGLTADPLTFTLVLAAPTPSAGSPVHWLAGIPGVFPSVPLVLPAGSMTPLAGQVWDALAVVLTPTGFVASIVDRVAW